MIFLLIKYLLLRSRLHGLRSRSSRTFTTQLYQDSLPFSCKLFETNSASLNKVSLLFSKWTQYFIIFNIIVKNNGKRPNSAITAELVLFLFTPRIQFKLLEWSFSITISLHSLYNDEQLSSFDGSQAPQNLWSIE